MAGSLFHIVAEPVWREACQMGEYAPESLYDEGFVHCSYADQVQGVAQAIYPGVPGMIVVELDEGQLNASVDVEPVVGSTERFPHVYGPINTDAQIGERPLFSDGGAGA